MSSKLTQAFYERFKQQEEYGGIDKPVNNIKPIVSVSVATYQHGKYIKECLDSIIGQQTNFPYEIIIGEDGSTDETKDICIEYANKYPDRIRLFLRDRKLSQYYEDGKYLARFNGYWNWMSARGEYIAMCEGDDYWIDENKLQRQVEYLSVNTECGLVHSKAKVYIESIQKFTKQTFGRPVSTFEDFLLGNPVSTPTVLFKREFVLKYMNDIDPLSKGWKMGDYPLWLYISFKSKIGFINVSQVVYRQLVESASNSKNYKIRLDFIKSYRDIKLYFHEKFCSVMQNTVIWESYLSAITHIYITYGIKNLSNLYEEYRKCSVDTVKIITLRILISNYLLRLLLRYFWKMR